MPKILIVDNEPNILEVMQLGLRLNGYEVDIAPTGHIALQRIKHRRYDVILLDLIMPEMNGFEILKRIKQRGSTAKIIVISGDTSSGASDETLACGASAYLEKPFSLEALNEIIINSLDGERLNQYA